MELIRDLVWHLPQAERATTQNGGWQCARVLQHESVLTGKPQRRRLPHTVHEIHETDNCAKGQRMERRKLQVAVLRAVNDIGDERLGREVFIARHVFAGMDRQCATKTRPPIAVLDVFTSAQNGSCPRLANG